MFSLGLSLPRLLQQNTIDWGLGNNRNLVCRGMKDGKSKIKIMTDLGPVGGSVTGSQMVVFSIRFPTVEGIRVLLGLFHKGTTLMTYSSPKCPTS